MSKTENLIDSYEQRRIDTLTDEMHFHELLAFASEVCFGYQLHLDEYKPPQDESSQVLAQLGARGLKCLLDSDRELLIKHGWDERAVNGESDDEYLWIDAPYRFPGHMSDEPKLHLVHEAKQFGQELLDTAYRCLGQEVHEKIREFQQATSDEAQMKVILWLYRRLNDLAYKCRGLDGDNNSEEIDGMYHPLRLSPLAIGRFPDHRLSPTCLGVSIIAASFFEKAGVEHLHGGVMKTAMHSQLEAAALFLRDVPRIIEEKGIPDSSFVEEVRSKIATTSRSIEEKVGFDAGFHAANLVKLQSGAWATLDANFQIITYDDRPDEKKDEVSAALKEFEESAPGLELTLLDWTGSAVSYLHSWIEKIEVPHYDGDELRRTFLETEESVPEAIYQLIKPKIGSENISKGARKAVEYVLSQCSSKAFYDCFEKYVLWNEPLEVVRQRCMEDERYLERRIEDIKNLWIPIIASMAVQAANASAEAYHYDNHEMVEVGLPAQRIGLAVLKDFDSYCGGTLSPSFWISNWASEIPVIDAIADDSNRPGQTNLTKNHAATMGWKFLRYNKDSGIVKEFMARSRRGEENAEG